jgi:hypothetical protein
MKVEKGKMLGRRGGEEERGCRDGGKERGEREGEKGENRRRKKVEKEESGEVGQ